MSQQSLQQRCSAAAELLTRNKRVVAFTGAGISTESGLSDFRSPGGVWERHRVVTYQEFLASAEARRDYWRMRRELIPAVLAARPNRAHQVLAELEQNQRLLGVITQNIDGLHQQAGSRRVIELHGSNRQAHCLSCGRCWPIEEILTRLQQGDLEPRCGDCGGLIKPSTVSFGQAMPKAALDEALQLAQDCSLLLMVGSSLQVQPAALIPAHAAQAGAQLIFINRTDTPYDQLARLRFNEDAGKVLSEILRQSRAGQW